MAQQLVHFVRWFNHRCPWNQFKPSLGKRVQQFLDHAPKRRVYENIAGDLRLSLDLSITEERWMYLNMYDIAALQLVRRVLRPGDVAIDAGANIGFFSLIMWRQVGQAGRVHAFEPQPAAVERLRENASLNQADRIIIVPKGVWRESSQATLYHFDDVPMNEASLGNRDDRQVDQTIDVELTRIDDEVTGSPRLVKLDVEGAELAAIEGASRVLFGGPPPHLMIELNPATCRSFDYHPIAIVDSILKRQPGYRLHLIKTRRLVRTRRDELARILDENPQKLLNVWFEPL